MSFKLFIYYCAVCGAWFGFFGWLLGHNIAPDNLGGTTESAALFRTILKGLSLGMLVALGLGLVDALWNSSSRQWGPVILRSLFVALIGCFSGLVGSGVGQGLYSLTRWGIMITVGWLLTGLLIGTSVGFCDMIARLSQGQNPSGTVRKVINGVIGGSLGGLLGGLLYQSLSWALSFLLKKESETILSGPAWGFVALGACIGLFIGLAQVMLKEAWIKIEAGFRPGRELILSKDETTIGRSEACDIGLFGDPDIDKVHARILLKDNRYRIEDAGSPMGTFLNDQKITQATQLKSGDAIRVGKSVLRFGERQKSQSDAR